MLEKANGGPVPIETPHGHPSRQDGAKGRLVEVVIPHVGESIEARRCGLGHDFTVAPLCNRSPSRRRARAARGLRGTSSRPRPQPRRRSAASTRAGRTSRPRSTDSSSAIVVQISSRSYAVWSSRSDRSGFEARSVRGALPDRCRRDGRGLSRPRPAPRPRGRDQGAACRPDGRRGSPPAIRPGGARRLRAEPPEHRDDLRDRVGGRDRLHRDGVRPGTEPRRDDPEAGDAARRGPACLDPDRRRAGERARLRDRAP